MKKSTPKESKVTKNVEKVATSPAQNDLKNVILVTLLLLLIGLSIWLVLNSFEVFTRSPNLSRNTSVIANNQQIVGSDDVANGDRELITGEANEYGFGEYPINNEETRKVRFGDYYIYTELPSGFFFANSDLGYSEDGVETLSMIVERNFTEYPPEYPQQTNISNSEPILVFFQSEPYFYAEATNRADIYPEFDSVVVDGEEYLYRTYSNGDGSNVVASFFAHHIIMLEEDLYVAVFSTYGARAGSYCDTDCNREEDFNGGLTCVELEDCTDYEDFVYRYTTSDEQLEAARQLVEDLIWEAI